MRQYLRRLADLRHLVALLTPPPVPSPQPMPSLPIDYTPKPNVTSSRKFKVEGIEALGVSFTPEESSRGRFPLFVTVNGDGKRVYIVRGPGVLRCDDGLITKLEVDAAPGGAFEGDVWNVTLYPEGCSREEMRPLNSREGHMITVQPGAVPLFEFDTRVNLAPFETLGASHWFGVKGGDFYINPDAPGAFTPDDMYQPDTDPGLSMPVNIPRRFYPAWDVSRFESIVFGVEVPFPGNISGNDDRFVTEWGADWNLLPLLECCMHSGGGVITQATMGTLGDFGQRTPDVQLGMNGFNGYIRTGQGIASETTLTREMASHFPFARFLVRIPLDSNVGPEAFAPSVPPDPARVYPFLRVYAYGTF